MKQVTLSGMDTRITKLEGQLKDALARIEELEKRPTRAPSNRALDNKAQAILDWLKKHEGMKMPPAGIAANVPDLDQKEAQTRLSTMARNGILQTASAPGGTRPVYWYQSESEEF